MTTLARLLHPRHVAVFGGGWAANVVEQCRKMGFKGAVWPVHPTRETLGGVPCYRSIADLPEAPDAAFIGVNRHATLDVVAELARVGAGGAVCFASGFAEAEDGREAGAALQARLVAAAGDMAVLGPNCYGLINYLDGALLWPDQHGGTRAERGVAILGQSSNMLINMTMQARALPIAYCIAAGNQAQQDLASIALALVRDPRVSAIGLHIEGVRDVRGVEALAAAARDAGKPVVALKVGRSASAQAATISHTASISGGDAAGRAFLRRLGIALVDTLPEFLETLKFLHAVGPLPGRAIASVSCSGGEASLIADLAEGRALSFRPFTPEEKAGIAAALGPQVTVANPLDYHTFVWGDAAAMERAFTAVTTAGHDLTIFILDFPRPDRCDDASWQPAVEAICAAARAGGRAVAVAATLPEAMPEARAAALLAAGIAPMGGLAETLTAAEAAAHVAECRALPPPP
ncbi:MAG TPA: CoA-binding protein, partial [Thermohalobaculum sp.]|nr:CoA-binding protein [Thermohalobaculum sp.]